MQAILGGILETKYYLYDLLSTHPDMVCVNPDDSGLITLFRVYPKGIDAKAQFQRELNEPASRGRSAEAQQADRRPLATSCSSGSAPARKSTANTRPT